MGGSAWAVMLGRRCMVGIAWAAGHGQQSMSQRGSQAGQHNIKAGTAADSEEAGMASKVVSRRGGTGCGAAVQQAAHHAGGPAAEVTSAVATAAAPRESAEPAAGCRLGGGGDGARIEDGSLAGSSSGCRDDGGRGDGIWLRRGGNDGGGGIGGGGEGGGAVVGARIASSHRGRLHHSQLGMRQYWHGGRRSGVRRRVAASSRAAGDKCIFS